MFVLDAAAERDLIDLQDALMLQNRSYAVRVALREAMERRREIRAKIGRPDNGDLRESPELLTSSGTMLAVPQEVGTIGNQG